VVSESLFSMDSDLADVEALAALGIRHGAAFVLDEAHAMGALGPEGRGTPASQEAHRRQRSRRPDVT
jgi:7-keto-8-aminopelargonate synthetase-like enzyme